MGFKRRGPPTPLVASQKPLRPKLKGFKPVKRATRKPSKSEINREHKRILEILEAAAAGTSGEYPKLFPSVRVHKNKDGTIDGELLITGLPRGVGAEDALEALWEYLPNAIPDTFISMGIKHTDREGEASADRRYRGKQTEGGRIYWAHTNYQDAGKRANMVANILTAQETMLKNLQRKRRRKPRDVFIRLHWNKGKVRPKR